MRKLTELDDIPKHLCFEEVQVTFSALKEKAKSYRLPNTVLDKAEYSAEGLAQLLVLEQMVRAKGKPWVPELSVMFRNIITDDYMIYISNGTLLVSPNRAAILHKEGHLGDLTDIKVILLDPLPDNLLGTWIPQIENRYRLTEQIFGTPRMYLDENNNLITR